MQFLGAEHKRHRDSLGVKLLNNLFLISASHPEERACHEGRSLLILNSDAPLRAVFALLLWEVWRHVSGPCSFQLSEEIGRFKLKACGNSHAERTEQKGVTTGGKSDWATAWKKTSTSNQSHYAAEIDSATLSSFCFHLLFWDDAFKSSAHSSYRLHYWIFFLFSQIFPILLWNRYIRSIASFFHTLDLDITLFWTFVYIFLKVPT